MFNFFPPAHNTTLLLIICYYNTVRRVHIYCATTAGKSHRDPPENGVGPASSAPSNCKRIIELWVGVRGFFNNHT